MRKLAMIVGLLVATATAAWAVPQFLDIQGTLIESGTPVDGPQTVTFKIFNTETGGSSLFSETDDVSFSAGVFNVFLGTNTTGGIPLSYFDGADKYVQLTIGTTDYPRLRIMSVGYAFRAAQAEALAPGATAQFELIDITTITANVITAASSITASAFFGDGSHLTGIASSSSLAGLYVSKASDTMSGPLTVPSLTISTFAVADFSDINFNGTNAGRLISRHGLGAIIGSDPIDSTANFTILAGAGETELFNVGQNGEASFDEHLTIRNSSLTLTGSSGYIFTGSSITAGAFFGDGSHLTGITTAGETAYFAGAKTFGSSVTVIDAIAAGSSVTASSFFGDGSHLTGVTGTDSTKVSKAGDTMTGALNLSNTPMNLTGGSGNIVGQASMTASAFFGDGSHLTGIVGETPYFAPAKTYGSSVTVADAVLANSSVTASAFFGDGSHLSGVTGTDISKVSKTGDTMTGSLNLSNVALNATGAAGDIVGQASMTASAFFGDGSHLTGVSGTDTSKVAKTGDTMTGALNLSGAAINLSGASGNLVGQASVTASAFFGDGSHLTGISATDVARVAKAGDTMTGALNLSDVPLNLTGSSGNIIGQASMTASAFFGDGSHLTGVTGSDSSKVSKSGDSMTGQLTLFGSTLTVTGSGFSVGSSTFVIAGGSATFGQGLTAGALTTGNTRINGNASGFALDVAPGNTNGSVIRTSDDGYFQFGSPSSNNGLSYRSGGNFDLDANSGDLVFLTGGAERGRFKSSNLGIGTANPAAALDVVGGAQFGSGARKSTFTVLGDLVVADGSSITLSGAGGYLNAASSVNASAFFGDGSHLTGISAAGEVAFFGAAKTFGSSVTVADALLAGSSVTAAAFFGDGSHLANVIGTDNTKVDKMGDTMTGQLTIAGSTLTVSGNAFSVGGATFVVVGGAIGLGTTSPMARLDVNGEAAFGSAGKSTFTSTGALSLADGADLLLSGSAGYITSGSSINASAFFGDGSHLTGVTGAEANTFSSSKTFSSDVLGKSSITASAFFGDGSHLSGLPSAEANTFTSSKTFTSTVLGQSSITASAFFGDASHLTGISCRPGAGASSVLCTGQSNTAEGNLSFAGGGFDNHARSAYSVVGGGAGNDSEGPGGTVGGGSDNWVTADSGTISGGSGNRAGALNATVGGGRSNVAFGSFAVIPGGIGNYAMAYAATVGGGDGNEAKGSWGTVPGGTGNKAIGDASFAAGVGAVAAAQNSFVWSDSRGWLNQVIGNTTDQFLVYARGGVYLQTSSLTVTGEIDAPSSNVNAMAFYGDGSHLTGIGEQNTFSSSKTFTSDVLVASSVSASAFFGDGSHLSGVIGTDSTKVSKAGDTMTGALNVTNAQINMSGAAGNLVSQASITASAFFGDGSGLTGVIATPAGSAGGGLSGTYPNPSLGVGVVHASNIANSAVGDSQSSISTAGISGVFQLDKGGLGNTIGMAASVATGGVDFSTITTQLASLSTSISGDEIVLSQLGTSTNSIDAAKVNRNGDAMTGQLTLYGSTLTVMGGAFSVGVTTFVVSGGNVGIGVPNPVTTLDILGSAQIGSGVAKSTITADGQIRIPYGVAAGSAVFTGGITAASGTFTASGSAQYSAQFSSGIWIQGGGIKWPDGTMSTTAVTGEFNTFAGSKTFTDSANGIKVISSVTAGAFFGDGSHLSGIGVGQEVLFLSSQAFTSATSASFSLSLASADAVVDCDIAIKQNTTTGALHLSFNGDAGASNYEYTHQYDSASSLAAASDNANTFILLHQYTVGVGRAAHSHFNYAVDLAAPELVINYQAGLHNSAGNMSSTKGAGIWKGGNTATYGTLTTSAGTMSGSVRCFYTKF